MASKVVRDESEQVDNTLVVVALDFGSSYSGYAFSFRNNPYEIYANQQWGCGKYHLNSYKTPTCVLINKDNSKDCQFGYTAEDLYADIQTENETDKYYFFDRFKMQLHLRKDISEQMRIYDIRGGSLPAVDVFSTAISSLKENVLEHLKQRGSSIGLNDIKWVLTVPAIWRDKAKSFMRLCAEKAGINKDRLFLALEPEAASLYCQHLYRKPNEHGVITGPAIVKQGVPYLVVDIGGGTVDITAHEKEIHDRVRELCPPSGAACGGGAVEQEFLGILEEIVGTSVIDIMRKEYAGDYFDLIREFELVKRGVLKKRQKINIRIPFASLNNLCKRCRQMSFQEALDSSKYKDTFCLVSDKLQMDKEYVISLFKKTTDNIIEEIQITLRQAESSETPGNINIFLLVGGFSESDIIQKAIKEAFPDKSIIIPDDPTLAVVKGAVLFGHTPDFVSSRYTRFAYGRRIMPVFAESKHDRNRSIIVKETLRCKDVFELFMEKNAYCSIGDVRRVQYHTVDKMQKTIKVAVYVSDNNKTVYVDEDGCEKLGELIVEIPKPTNERQFVDTEFQFGGTELIVKAKVHGTQDACVAQFRLI